MQETTQDNTLDDLAKSTIAIQEPGGSGKVLGTGVIVTDDGLILTCFHVVGDTKSKTINHNSIDVYFPEFKVTKSAQIVNEYSDPSIDVAFFKIQGGLPENAVVSSLGESIIFGHKFASIGFRKSQIFEKLSSSGEIRIKTSFKTKVGIESPSLIQLYSDDIESGMSGAPVLDLETNRVVGIISEHWVTLSNIDTKLNFAIPVSSIIEKSQSAAASSILKENNPGLIKIRQFMDRMGLGNSDIYRRFDDLYVPPVGYEDIADTLQKSHCVFITGTKEYGKTYTAIRLLWEYYKKGYEPKYISETKEEAAKIVKQLTESDDRLRNNAIYIEDPVGKTEYIPNEDFRRHIVSALKNTKRQDVYLIITMREEIYNEFNPIGKVDPEVYIEKLSIAKHSYDYERRKEMLLRWAEVMNCRWLQNDKLRNTVLEALQYESILPTPLNIKDFAMETDQTFSDS